MKGRGADDRDGKFVRHHESAPFCGRSSRGVSMPGRASREAINFAGYTRQCKGPGHALKTESGAYDSPRIGRREIPSQCSSTEA